MSARGRSSKSEKDDAEREAYLTIECGFCGKTHGAYMRHYEILRGSCGKFFWALRPEQSGPLKLVNHPGFFVKAA